MGLLTAISVWQANPHKRLRQLYGPRMMGQYKGVPLGELSPHVYAIAEKVFLPSMWDQDEPIASAEMIVIMAFMHI